MRQGLDSLTVYGEKQIPFGDDNQNSNGKSSRSIPSGDDNQNSNGKSSRSIPSG